MERFEIQQYASELENRQDLVDLLNEIKRAALGDKYHSFQEKQIAYYCNPKRTDCIRYINFTIPKKSGGERTISAPVRGLKSILFSLNTLLQALYEPSKYAMGFAPGRSVVDNAKLHIGQRYIYNIDLKDFFPSIDKSRVWKRLTLPPFNFNSDIAHTIAGLCTMRIVEEGKERFVLPQGAPTSPILTNAICDTLDRRLGAVAKRFGLRYSRYADDITFSSLHYVYGKDGEFIKELHRIIKEQNFTINESKTRLQSLGYRQEVTGVIVSDKINVCQEYVREIKTLLHIWDKYGYMAACNSYAKSHHIKKDGTRRASSPKLELVIAGKLQYMKMVKSAEDAVYLNLQTKFNTLVKSIKKVEFAIGGRDIAYLQTMTREQFRKEKLVDITIDAENKDAYYEIGDQRYNVIISRSISEGILLQLATCSANDECWNKYRISLCENNNVQFYMLHKCFKERKVEAKTDIKLEDIENIFTYLESNSYENKKTKTIDKKSSNIFERVIRWIRR